MKIALLLLTIDNPFFIDNIKEYLNENTKLYIHAKNPNNLDSYFKKYLIKNLIETAWGDMSLVYATINLLEASIEDCDYFYLISGDTYINKTPEIFDLSCFDLLKEYNVKTSIPIYKTSQWYGLNKQDAMTIIKTKNKYKNIFYKVKLDGAYDENYFLTVLHREKHNYKYNIKKVMYVKWLDNVISKHPFIFNKLTECDLYLCRNSFFIRKCIDTFKINKTETQDNLYIFYIGSETNQDEITKVELNKIDYIIITSLDTNKIKKDILKNTFYIIPIIWKFYEETKTSLTKDIIVSPWNKIIFFPENFIKQNFYKK
jgi:hypothetical protein